MTQPAYHHSPLTKSAGIKHVKSPIDEAKFKQLPVKSLNQKKEWRNVVEYAPEQSCSAMQATPS